ncbi:hypothetical protein F1511_03720, partial [Klebsiella oxytoca]|nr:hypothetical protein [Klebsiella oxytoca]
RPRRAPRAPPPAPPPPAAPIGYNIGAETPNEIAISVLAEILQVKNGAPGGLMDQVRQSCQPDCVAEAVAI